MRHRDGSLKPDELFEALPVEYRDQITVLYLKTLDSEDIGFVVFFYEGINGQEKDSQAEKKNEQKKKRPKKKKIKGGKRSQR